MQVEKQRELEKVSRETRELQAVVEVGGGAGRVQVSGILTGQVCGGTEGALRGDGRDGSGITEGESLRGGTGGSYGICPGVMLTEDAGRARYLSPPRV